MKRKSAIIFFMYCLFLGSIFLEPGKAFGQSEDILRIDSVSVFPGDEGFVIIGWTLQTSELVGEIEIHRQLPEGTYALIFTIPGFTINQFVDNGVNANLGPVSYYVAAFGENEQTLAVSEAHSTIHFSGAEADFCSGDIKLFWSNYRVTTSSGTPVPLPVPFDSLRLQISSDGINYSTIETFEQPPTSDNLQEYVMEGLEPGEYFFRIQSFNSGNGRTSTSNVMQFGYDPPQLEDFVIDYIDVFDNQEMHISFRGAGDPEAFLYEVYRSSEAEAWYELIEDSLSMEVFVDYPDLLQGPWFYRVKARLADWECELPVYETPGVFSSLFLRVAPLPGARAYEFTWEHFFPEDLSYSYELLMESGAGIWVAVPGFLNAGAPSFVFELPADLSGRLVFKLEASEQGDPTQGVSSNFVAIEVEPLVFLPNAFRPTSDMEMNQVFKPVFPGFDPEGYELTIFNRWGQVIFITDDPDNGWDGKHDGKVASPGVYSFQLKYRAPGGKSYEKSGVITLVF